MTARGVFVTGTDTGIGKTHASGALLAALRARGLRAVGMKPVASGCRETLEGLRNEDAEALIAASDPRRPMPTAIRSRSPRRSRRTSPRARPASRSRSTPIARRVRARSRDGADRVVVEGVGGWWRRCRIR